MSDVHDLEDLAEFARNGSHRAFAAIVGRHIDLVYSAALRQLRGDTHRAQDVTQTVFLHLAQKARGLRRETVLGAWLLVATRYVARDALRAAARRKRHEAEAAMTRKELASDAAAAAEATAERDEETARLTAHLDDALAALPAGDRKLIVLRYLQRRSAAEAATVLGISAAAVRQRAHRAIDRLRAYFVGRGVNVSAAVVAVTLMKGAVVPAPVGLAASVVAAQAANATVGAAGLTTKGAVFLMGVKTKIAIVAAVVLLMVGGTLVAYRPWERAQAKQDATAPAPALPAQLAIAAPATAPASPPSDWRVRFNQVYGLAGDQTVKHVGPPYIPERLKFMKTMPMIGGLSPDQHQMTLEWDGRQANWISMSGNKGSLAGFLQMGVRLRPFELEEWGGKYALPMNGDWVVRKNATAAERLRGVERVLLDEFGRHVRFEQRRVPRETIVVRGTYAYRALEDSQVIDGSEVIDVVGRKRMPGREALVGDGTFATFCAHLENVLVRRVIDETGAGAAKADLRVKWRDHQPAAEEFDDVLRKLEWQTSLTFSREKRDTDVWFMVDVP
jgi:RNA polymerase sigma factor (sigma-70 family)